MLVFRDIQLKKTVKCDVPPVHLFSLTFVNRVTGAVRMLPSFNLQTRDIS